LINVILNEPDIGEEVWTRIAQNQDPDIRRTVANKTSTPAAAFFILAKDKDRTVLRGVAQNASTPAKVLIDLAGSEDEFTRLDVAANPRSPAEALAIIVSNKNADLFELKFAAKNPNVSNETLKILVTKESFVSKIATSVLNYRKKMGLSEQLFRRLVTQMM
jgi:hypothetical protein